jgi:hypothetical protein
MISLNEVRQALPTHLKSAATQSLTDKLNNIASEPEVVEIVRNNFVSYTHVLKAGKFKAEDYLNAVVYVSFKLMRMTNQDAYRCTFPDRHLKLIARGADDKEISAYVAAYNKNQLVNLIMEQSIIPSWVLNQDYYQQAINIQVTLMMDVAVSPKVRSDAANSLLTHLKKPDAVKIDLNLGIVENSGMGELRDMLTTMAQTQQDMIAQGVPTSLIAHQKIGRKLDPDAIDAEVVETQTL